MHHLRRLLKRGPLDPQNASLPQRLPAELMVLIITLVKREDLATFCRVSRMTQAIAEPLLYHTLNLVKAAGKRTLSTAQENRLLWTIQHLPRLSTLVTEVNLVIRSGTICKIYGNPRSSCSCDEHDSQFGQALVSLSSLQALHLGCILCPARYERHSYLFRHTTRRLRSFAFHCSCTMRDVDYAVKLLSSPFISSVTALAFNLDLSTPFQDQRGHELLVSALQEPEFLPNLKAVGHGGSWIADLLISKRAVERIGVISGPKGPSIWVENAKENIFKHSGDLSAFFVESVLQWLPAMERTPYPFRNLSSLGMFSFNHDPDDSTVERMAFLGRLENLKVIHINQKHTHSKGVILVKITPAFIVALGKVNVKIMYVRIAKRAGEPNPVLWERKGSSDD